MALSLLLMATMMMAIEGRSADEIEYHLTLLREAGLVDSPGSQPAAGGITFRRLTNEGHDALVTASEKQQAPVRAGDGVAISNAGSFAQHRRGISSCASSAANRTASTSQCWTPQTGATTIEPRPNNQLIDQSLILEGRSFHAPHPMHHRTRP